MFYVVRTCVGWGLCVRVKNSSSSSPAQGGEKKKGDAASSLKGMGHSLRDRFSHSDHGPVGSDHVEEKERLKIGPSEKTVERKRPFFGFL